MIQFTQISHRPTPLIFPIYLQHLFSFPHSITYAHRCLNPLNRSLQLYYIWGQEGPDLNRSLWMHQQRTFTCLTICAGVLLWTFLSSCDSIKNVLYINALKSKVRVIRHTWRTNVSLLCYRNGRKGNMRRFWVKSSIQLWPTWTSSSLQKTASTTSPGTWLATPRGCDNNFANEMSLNMLNKSASYFSHHIIKVTWKGRKCHC